MTMKIASAISLVCAAQKSAKFKMPLLSKDIWKTVDEYLSVQTKPNLNAMHRNFGQFSRKYKDLSGEIKKKLWSTDMDWLFFKDSETEKIIAENVDERGDHGRTALHRAADLTDDAELARALIEAGVDVNVQDDFGLTALHIAAAENNLKIGKCLVEAGARLDLRQNYNKTPLDAAIIFENEKFAEMLSKK